MQRFPARPSFDVYRKLFPVRIDAVMPARIGYAIAREMPQPVVLPASHSGSDASDLTRTIAAAGLSTAWLHED